MSKSPIDLRKKRLPPLVAAVFVLFTVACSKEPNPLDQLSPARSRPTGKREYGEIKPVMLPFPDSAQKALEAVGQKGAPLKEIPIYFRSLAIVVYRDKFDAKDYMRRIAEAYVAFSEVESFAKNADVWTIQMNSRDGAGFVVMSCSPKVSAEYAKGGDLTKFLGDCDFLMINDVIISNRDERVGYYEGRLAAPGSTPVATPEKPL